MIDLGFALFLAIIAAGLGRRLLSTIGQDPDHPLDSVALAIPLGFGVLVMGILALGGAGWLNLAGLAIHLGIATELGVRLGANSISRLVGGARTLGTTFHRGPLDATLLILGTVTVVATGVAAQAAVTDGDALCYHLQVPKSFLISGTIHFDPDLHETVYPLMTEMLYTMALEFRGPVACRCVQWVLGLVFAANVTALARPTLGVRCWWAGVVALLVPAVTNGMSAPLNDVALACIGTSAILAFLRLLERPSAGAAVVTGTMLGLACGVKYPALVLAGLLITAIAARPLLRGDAPGRRRFAPWIRHALVTCGAMLAVGGIWYLRAFLHTGNPVYPFFKNWFGGAGLAEVLAPEKRPLAIDVWHLATSLIPLTLEPDRFDSFAHQFGPIFLLFLPALLIERVPRRVGLLAMIGYAFILACMTQRQSMRFLLLAVGPMSVGVAWMAASWSSRRTMATKLLLGLMVAVLAMEASIALVRAGRVASVVAGGESISDFLFRCEPTYRVGQWISKNLPVSARLIGQDHRGFYIPRPYTMELAHRRRTGLGGQGESSRVVATRLREAGFTHLLLCPPGPGNLDEFDPTLGRVLEPWLAGRTPIFRQDLADTNGVIRHYAIYDLAADVVQAHASEKMAR